MTILDIDIERFLTEWTILRKSLDFNIGAQNITTTGDLDCTNILCDKIGQAPSSNPNNPNIFASSLGMGGNIETSSSIITGQGAWSLSFANANSLEFNGSEGDSFIPSVTNFFDLGDNTHNWRELFVLNITAENNITADTLTTTAGIIGQTVSTQTAQLITNPTFSDGTKWDQTDNWTVAAGGAKPTAPGDLTEITPFTVVAGQSYTINVLVLPSNGLTFKIGGSSQFIDAGTDVIEFFSFILTASDATEFTITAGGGDPAREVFYVEVYEVVGDKFTNASFVGPTTMENIVISGSTISHEPPEASNLIIQNTSTSSDIIFKAKGAGGSAAEMFRFIGDFASFQGKTATASGNNSFAMGTSCRATGTNSFAVGASTDATGNTSVAIGSGADASGGSDVALGNTAVTTADSAIAIGRTTTASGIGALAIGVSTVASDTFSIAIGVSFTNSVASTIGMGISAKDFTISATDLTWNGIASLGDGGATNYTEFSATGDQVFVGTAGLPFAEIYARDNTTTTSTSTTKTQILIFDINGEFNNMTPDHTNDHITVVKAGKYKIDASISLKNSSGSAHVISLEMYKNDGTVVFNNIHAGRTLGTGSDVGNLTMSGIVDLAVDDTIEIWITSDSASARTVTVEDINFCAIQTGG